MKKEHLFKIKKLEKKLALIIGILIAVLHFYRAVFGKSLNHCSNKSAGTHFHAERVTGWKTATKIDTKIFYLVSKTVTIFLCFAISLIRYNVVVNAI